MTYRVFVRNWWKRSKRSPIGLEPNPSARKTTLGYVNTEDEARTMCRNYNETHKPGRLSRKAEYTKE